MCINNIGFMINKKALRSEHMTKGIFGYRSRFLSIIEYRQGVETFKMFCIPWDTKKKLAQVYLQMM